MESGRPIVAAVGLFFGGLIVGSGPGVTREGNTAHAAMVEPKNDRDSVLGAKAPLKRGPIAPALHKLIGGAYGGGIDSDIDPLRWSRAPGRRPADSGDPSDPLDGLKMPDLPIPRTPAILKYVRYFSESAEGRKTFSEALRRSGRYQEVIAKTFREIGLPKDLVAVAFIESGFNVEAVSTAGASGMWQFMPGTARAYGLQVESSIDERAGIWSSTEAAAHHLSDLYARFRSWELALAAYNLGYDSLDKRLDEMEADDFWALAETPGGLPNETVHYVPKVLAAAVVFANLDALGFGDVDREPPIDAAEIDVPPDTKLAVVARAAGTSLRVLRDLNPELLADTVPDRGSRAPVHVPRGGAARARAMLPKLASDDPDTLRVSEDFDWGRDDAKSGQTRLERTSAAVREPHHRRHHIAEKHAEQPVVRHAEKAREAAPRERAERTEHADRREREEPREREEKPRFVKQPAREDDAAPITKNAPEPTKKDDDDEPELAPATPPVIVERTPAPPKPTTTRVLYRVVAGDSLSQIALTLGVTVDQILAQTHVISASQIQVGQLLDLRIPTKNVPTGISE